VGDNSAGIAVLLSQAEGFLHKNITLAFSVGEEGLGNLRGARELVRRLRPQMLVAVDGYMPSLISQAVGSVRWRARLRGPGGHAWGDRHNPTPVPAMAWAMTQIYDISRPQHTSLNIGRVWGGEAINAIPKEVGLELDIRASEASVLAALSGQTRSILMEAAQKFRVVLELEVLGERPAGTTASPQMLAAAKAALFEAGYEVRFVPGSTDASAGVEAGVPAMALGVYVGGQAHTPEEWVEAESLYRGAKALRALVGRLG
jgi:acetylornithine deacetylase/succinyl-diaminopimelate desuccinylase-like protein